MIILLLILIICVLWWRIYGGPRDVTSPHPRSVQVLDSMGPNYSYESKLEFAAMEDLLVKYERESIQKKNSSRLLEAQHLSQQIKNRFPGVDFSYHDNLILPQIKNPLKVIDTNI
jgi:hypothetical protein